MTLLSRIRAARPGARRPVGCGPSDDAAERWQRYWNVAFYLLLAAATIAAVADIATGWERRAGFVLVGTFLVGWYLAYISSGRAWYDGRGAASRYYLGLVGAFVALVLLHPAAMLLTAALYWQLYSLAPVRWSIPGSALLTVLIWFLSAWRSGRVPDLAPQQFLLFAVTVTVSGLLAAYIDAIIRQSRERQRLLDELAATRRELAAAERQAGVEQERQRLAGEIHDTLAQGFASIVVHLQAAEMADAGTTAARTHLDAAERAARDGLAESRRLVWALRPEALTRASLPDAVRRTASRWTSPDGATAYATVVGTPRRLAPEAEVALLRATQEALANVARHAGATKATVTLSYLDDAVALDVRDDGTGFDPAARRRRSGTADDASGFGLIGMEERVEALGGSVTIESEPGGGTALAVNLPAPPPPECETSGATLERTVVGDPTPGTRLVPEAVGG